MGRHQEGGLDIPVYDSSRRALIKALPLFGLSLLFTPNLVHAGTDPILDNAQTSLLDFMAEVMKPDSFPRRDIISDMRTSVNRTDQRLKFFEESRTPEGLIVKSICEVSPENSLLNLYVGVNHPNVDNAKTYLSEERVTDTVEKDFNIPEIARAVPWNRYRRHDQSPATEKFWDNEDGSLDFRGGMLWGPNPAEGPNYVAYAGRTWPGTLQYENRSMFADPKF